MIQTLTSSNRLGRWTTLNLAYIARLRLLPSLASNAPFRRAFESHLKDLESFELERFKALSSFGPEDVILLAKKFDEDQAKASHFRRCAQRILPFLKVVTQYSGMVGSLIQYAPAPTSLVWGGVMCVMQLITQYSAYFDKVIELFEELGGVLRPLSDYAEVIYKDNAAVQDALVALYGDLLKFCRVASAVFLSKNGKPRSGLGTFVLQIWRPFESQFDDVKGQFRKHLQAVELETTVADRRLMHNEVGLQTVYRDDTNAQLRRLTLISEERGKEDTKLRRRLILNWMSSLDFRSSHEKAYGSRHEMTGSWFLHTEKFTDWLNAQDAALLWCCGKPGVGKSVLTSIVVEYVRSHAPKSQSSIAFVYCDSRQQIYSSSVMLIGSLLRQLCAKESDIPDPVSLKYDQVQQQGGESLTWLEMKTVFLQTLPLFRQESILVFDGLDECDDPAAICDLLKTAVSRPTNHVKIFVTSRSENRVIKPLLSCSPTISLNVAMVQEDIAAFVRAEVNSLCENGKLRIGDPELKQEIVETLIVKAEGMFLWVRFQMETLCSQTTDGEVRQALGRLPYGLEEVYERALRSVECQPPPMKALARKVIMFVLFSKRSLWIGELLEALAVVPGYRAIDPLHRLNNPSMIVPICAELITVDGNNLVQFAHSSIRDFLLNKSNNQQTPTCLTYAVESANVDIGRICLTYLLYERVKTQNFQLWDELQTFFNAHNFIIYASCYWADHIRGPSEVSLQNLILELIQCEGAAAYRRLWLDLWQTGFKRNDTLPLPAEIPNSLQITIEENLSHTVKYVPDLQSHLETKDIAGRTPLLTAIVEGKTLLATELLDCGADVKATGPKGVTALHYAARQLRNTDLVSRLITAGAELHARTDDGSSPMDYAASNSNLACLELLLAAPHSPELREAAVSQALCSAAGEDCIPVIELLLSNGGDVSYVNDIGWSPLHHAVHFQKLNTVKCLLRADANPNIHRGLICSPLEKAVWKGNMEIVELLLDAGGDLLLANGGATVLHWSTMSNNRHVVNWALQTGIDVNQRTTDGHSALMWAAEETTDPSILKDLLCAGALVHFKSIKAEVTALDIAAEKGSAECVRALLDAGAHPESKCANGYTSLSWAATNGHSNVVQIILETGAAFDTPDAEGKTPLVLAAHLGYNDVVKQLLAIGADLRTSDSKGFTALHYAVMGKHEGVIQVLLEASAAVDIKNSAGLTPLMIATWPDRQNAFEQLLGKGPGLNIQDESGYTALSYAASYGHVDIVKRLIDKGSDLDLPSNSGKCPCCAAPGLNLKPQSC